MKEDSTHPLIAQLRPIFVELKSCTSQTLDSVIFKLDYVVEEEKDALFHRNAIKSSSGPSAKVLFNWINQQIRELFEKADTERAGVRVLNALLNVEYMELSEKTKFFSELLVRLVLDTDDVVAATEAARVWGQLLTNGSSVTEGIIANCLNFATTLLFLPGWDSDFLNKNPLHQEIFDTSRLNLSHEGQFTDFPKYTKLAGCLLIDQLLCSVPSATVPYLHIILNGMRCVLIDYRKIVRLYASDMLYKALHVTYRSTDPGFYHRWQDVLLNDVLNGIIYDTGDILHGVFLSFNTILASIVAFEGEDRVVNLTQHSASVVQQVWHFINQHIVPITFSQDIRKAMFDTLPRLAKYNIELFKELTLSKVLEVADVCFTSTDPTVTDERPMLFCTISKLIVVMPTIVLSFLDRLVAYIEMSLVKRPNRDRCEEAVSCFAIMSEAAPNAVRPFLRCILAPLFAGIITIRFTQDIAKICTAFPELRSTCLSKMLEATKLQLQIAYLRQSTACRNKGSISADDTLQCILENLKVLASLDFTGYSTLQFLSDSVLRYVSSPHDEVRRAAIDLCFRLVLSGCSHSPCLRTEENYIVHRGCEHIRLINTVIKKLVNAAVADPESDIRLYTLNRFTEEYDSTLALKDIASSLFPALQDKYQNRIAAVRLLGRISWRNPACVYPMLRRVVVQCVTDIQLFHVVKKQVQATAILSVVVESASDMIHPYLSTLLHDCVKRLRDRDQPVPVQTVLLSCVGKLARYAEGADVDVVAAIRPVVVEHILDSSNIHKKQEAIRALVDIIRTTKEVNVYESHPELLPVLLSALHGGFKETWPVRLDVLKLMGVVGAVGPVRVKTITRYLRDNGMGGSSPTEALLPLNGNREEDAIAQSVVKNVLNVLQLPSLSDDQCMCGVQVIANVLSVKESIGDSLVPFHRDIITTILYHACNQPKVRDRLLNVLSRIAYLMGEHIRPYSDMLLSTVVSFLPSAETPVLMEVLCLASELRWSLKKDFRPHLSNLLPPLLIALQADPVNAGEPIFAFLIEMSTLLDSHLHNVLPCVCDVASNSSYPASCRVAAVDALRQFAKRLPHLALHATRTIHCLCRVLKDLEVVAMKQTNTSSAHFHNGIRSSETSHLHDPTLDCLVGVTLDALRDVARNLGSDFAKYIPMVFIVLEMYGSDGEEVKSFISAVVRGGGRVLASDVQRTVEETSERHRTNCRPPRRKSGDVFSSLLTVLSARDRETREDWNLWLKQIAVELLRSSPALSHGFACPLAQIHEPFARHMLHSAFAVCFGEMDNDTRETVIKMLGNVLRSERVPSEVLQGLLNLSEYMERIEMRFNPKQGSQGTYQGPLFDLKTLMDSSERCNLFAKALHYVEIEFYKTTYEYELSVMRGLPKPLPPEEWSSLIQLCEKSIYLCNLLGQRESAEGMLKYIQTNFSFLTGCGEAELPRIMDAQLFEKLQWWTQSLRAYEEGLIKEPNTLSSMSGLMRSLDNLGDSGRLMESWKCFLPRVSRKDAAELAPYGARAAWLLRRWDDMARITEYITDEGYVGTTAVFYRAVLATNRKQFREAERLIELCRKRLDSTLSALVAESYDRAYELFVGIQQLSELEEFAFVARNSKGLNHWQKLWEKRLSVMAYSGWAGTIANHTLVIQPRQELDMWLRFASLSRLYGRKQTSSEIIYELLGSQTIKSALNQPTPPSPAITLAAFQHLYDTQQRDQAIELLSMYLEKIESFDGTLCLDGGEKSLALCYSKLADWLLVKGKNQLVDGNYSHVSDKVANHLMRATSLDGQNGAIWHSWARFHHSLVTKKHHGSDIKQDEFTENIISAIDGYIRSICLSQELEDVLGFLSLWFMHASLPQVRSNNTLQSGILEIPPRVWLKVIPQIIARLHSRDVVVSDSVYRLLVIIAKSHPQALLYSLNFTNRSGQGSGPEQLERRKAAQRILSRIVELHHNGAAIVHDAALVCQELVRCAVGWIELWFDELERAWHQWGRDKNAHNVLMALKPLLDQLKSPQTLAESHFVSEFGEFLYGAYEAVEKAVSLGNYIFMEEAWSRFKVAVKRMDDQISNMTSLALQLVSPNLLQHGKNLSLVVPGQYNENGHYPRIASFQSILKVINSKQHPRRLYVNGTDGAIYKFLLKGHEDLRLDERIMQLLDFVNTLFEKHSTIQQQNCMIQVYSVTPLSDNAGLVGWVDNCDTLHQLIKTHRIHSRHLSREINLMLSYGVDLDRLTCIQHVEPFEFALENTEGNDLMNSLWMRAPSAESWLDRRTTYVCSLATMSMVGHILGLGDRHPSNLMIHAFSGRVVHIDFGDCFEVAQTRSTFPEKVPFRLTRMLIKAMEMGGIDGLFRHGCIAVMSMLREEGSSILALLEAFVHDPLVSWWRDESNESDVHPSKVSAQEGHSQITAYSALGESFRRYSVDYKGCGSSLLRRPVRQVSMASRSAWVGSLTPGTTISKHSSVNDSGDSRHQQTSKAQKVVHRIQQKLEGRDFLEPFPKRCDVSMHDGGLSVKSQVARLIEEAKSNENLCQHFQGWCPFW
ncbi:unnamed protein product [Phytomonas sp. EM1]|nr:unnamed protein product [Phytomonas sp. EM1]|eukprot:CCW63247.1 unnamed protein product [Phytomonas sp. isolate EM1]